MARRQISPSNLALFAGPSPATGTHTTSNIKELFGATSFSFDMSTTREDIAILGTAAADRIQTEPSAVTLDISYNISNLDNEKSLGFVVDGSSGAFANILNGSKDERNYFAMVAGDGNDAVGSVPGSTPCFGFGNGTINSWNFSAAVGGYPTSTITIEALDIKTYPDSDTEQLPAIDVNTGLVASGTFTLPTAVGNAFSGRDAVLRPRDINVNLSGLTGVFFDVAAACVQSVDFGVDFGRVGQQCLGAYFRRGSIMANTIPFTFDVEFLAKDLVYTRLSQFDCQTGIYSAEVSIRRPNCSGTGSIGASYSIRGMSLESLNYSADAGGDASSVTLSFAGNLGGANNQTRGIFMSGVANT